MAQFTYRMAFLSAAVTYGIVVYKAYRARMRTGKQTGLMNMLTDENVQYLGEPFVAWKSLSQIKVLTTCAQQWLWSGYFLVKLD